MYRDATSFTEYINTSTLLLRISLVVQNNTASNNNNSIGNNHVIADDDDDNYSIVSDDLSVTLDSLCINRKVPEN